MQTGGIDLARVVVVGTSCSGKTTFARHLAEIRGVPHIELDRLYWLPGWVEREPEHFLDLVTENTAAHAWVADGNYRRARDRLWSRATTIIWLDYPLPLVFWRALKRTTYRAITGQEVCNGNRESWQKALMGRDSILLWVLTSYRRLRRDYDALLDDGRYADTGRIRLRRPAVASAFLASVTPSERR